MTQLSEDIRQTFEGKRLLVTGGTGSIGSEIVRQLLTCEPEVLRIMSRDETRQQLLREELGQCDNLRFLVGDVRDYPRFRRAMAGVDYVFHAAALKHVPSCEYNPFEAVQTNVIGAKHLVDAALDEGIKKVIAISTDKAVNPGNTMGATKLLMEKLIASAILWVDDLALSCVRFGNVLGSRGSIVPLLKNQIRKGGPVTLTDCRMTRFMMSIQDAVRLVLSASIKSAGGEIFVLKMPRLKITDLVDVLIEHEAPKHGFAAGDIVIEETGVRPGEKMHEELLTTEEIRRVRELDDMYVVPPLSVKAAEIEVDTTMFYSDSAPHLGKDEIAALLVSAGAIN